MKILTLIIKQKWFDEIIAGTKTHEYRETMPHTERKFVQIVNEGSEDDGYITEMDEEVGWTKPLPIKYDALRLYVGYRKDRDSALVRVKNTTTKFIMQDNGTPLIYGLSDEDVANDIPFFIPLIVDYELGEIIEKKVKSRP